MHTKISSNAANIEIMKQASSSLNTSTESGPHSEQQLKYENERLKLALAQRWVMRWCMWIQKLKIELISIFFDDFQLRECEKMGNRIDNTEK